MESLIINNTTNNINRPCRNHEIRLDLTSSLQVRNKKVALSYIGLYYSWRNISAINNNNFFQYIWVDGLTYDVLMPDGFFQINDMSLYMQLIMYKNGHYMLDSFDNPMYFIRFASNPTYYCTTVDCFPVNIPSGGSNPCGITVFNSVPQLSVSPNALTTTLGLLAGSYPSTSGTISTYSVNSQLIPALTTVSTVYVACNLVGNALNQYRNVFYQFAPTSVYGTYISKEPYQPIFFNVDDGTYNSVSIMFYDQNYQPIPLIDRDITATVVFTEK